MDKKLLIICGVSAIWVLVAYWFLFMRKPSITASNIQNKDYGVDIISRPMGLIVNLFFDEKGDIDYTAFCDVSLKMKDVMAGTYILPEHLKTKQPEKKENEQSKQNENKNNSQNTPKQNQVINNSVQNNNDDFEGLIDVNGINNSSNK